MKLVTLRTTRFQYCTVARRRFTRGAFEFDVNRSCYFLNLSCVNFLTQETSMDILDQGPGACI